MKRLVLVIVVGLIALAGGLYWGVPGWLSQRAQPAVPAPDFTQDAGWLRHPDPLPPAVWEAGWALDFILLAHTPDTLDRGGLLATAADPVRKRLIEDTAVLDSVLSQFGAVFMPALRVPSATTRRPDSAATRDDVVSALAAYFKARNRGRGVVLFMQEEMVDTLGPLSDLLAEAGANEVRDRIALLIVPEGRLPVRAPGPDEGFTTLVLTRPALADPGVRLGDLFARANAPDLALQPPDIDAFQTHMAESTQAALRRLGETARKTVEPFGEIETIEIAPIMLPDEAGAPSRRN